MSALFYSFVADKEKAEAAKAALAAVRTARAAERAADAAEAAAAAERLFHSALSDPGTQRAVVCVDDEATATRLLAAAAGRAKVITYSGELGGRRAGAAPDAPLPDVYPESAELSIWDTLVVLATPAGRLEARCALVGAAAVGHIAAAAAAGVALGVPLPALAAGLKAARPVPGQSEGVDEGQPFACIVDDARTPAALDALLRAVRECGALSLVTVLGAKAGTGAAERAAMGRVAHRLSDVVIVTLDDPGQEDVHEALAQVVAGFEQEVYRSPDVVARMPPWPFLRDHSAFWGDQFCTDDPWAAMQFQTLAKRYVIADRYHAIRGALGMASEGYAIVIAGKGDQDWQLVGQARHWFHDGTEARAALRALPKKPKSLDMAVLPYRIADWPAEMNAFMDDL